MYLSYILLVDVHVYLYVVLLYNFTSIEATVLYDELWWMQMYNYSSIYQRYMLADLLYNQTFLFSENQTFRAKF